MRSLAWLLIVVLSNAAVFVGFQKLGRAMALTLKTDKKAHDALRWAYGCWFGYLLIQLAYVIVRGPRTGWEPSKWATGTFAVLLLGFLIYCVIISIRIALVSRFRMKALEDSIYVLPGKGEERGSFLPYNALPEMSEMVWKFWRPLKSFLPAGSLQVDILLPPDRAEKLHDHVLYLKVSPHGTREIGMVKWPPPAEEKVFVAPAKTAKKSAA